MQSRACSCLCLSVDFRTIFVLGSTAMVLSFFHDSVHYLTPKCYELVQLSITQHSSHFLKVKHNLFETKLLEMIAAVNFYLVRLKNSFEDVLLEMENFLIA